MIVHVLPVWCPGEIQRIQYLIILAQVFVYIYKIISVYCWKQGANRENMALCILRLYTDYYDFLIMAIIF